MWLASVQIYGNKRNCSTPTGFVWNNNVAVILMFWSTQQHQYGRRNVTSKRSIMPGKHIWDHYTFLGNCPPTPPLDQHFAPSETVSVNVGSGEG